MKNVKTADLTGAQLDWAVAKCEGINIEIQKGLDGTIFLLNTSDGIYATGYSTSWSQAGPIIERERLQVRPSMNSTIWFSLNISDDMDDWEFRCSGPTPLIAAMRCYITYKLGSEIEIPEELV